MHVSSGLTGGGPHCRALSGTLRWWKGFGGCCNSAGGGTSQSRLANWSGCMLIIIIAGTEGPVPTTLLALPFPRLQLINWLLHTCPLSPVAERVPNLVTLLLNSPRHVPIASAVIDYSSLCVLLCCSRACGQPSSPRAQLAASCAHCCCCQQLTVFVLLCCCRARPQPGGSSAQLATHRQRACCAAPAGGSVISLVALYIGTFGVSICLQLA